MIFKPLTALFVAAVLVTAVPQQVTNKRWDPATVFDPSEPIPSPAELSKCVDSAARLLRIDVNMQTDPELLKDILGTDMRLADSRDVIRLLGDDLSRAKPLRPMLEQVRRGITEVHPAVGVTLCAALADDTTLNTFINPNTAIITRTIHHMYLLEKITNKAADDRVFMGQVHNHITDTVKAISPHKSAIGHTWDLFRAAGLFGVAKAYTIDGTMSDYKKFRDDGFISPKEEAARKRGLTLNVVEATTADLFHGYFDNARVGKALASIGPSAIKVTGANRTIQYVGTMEYAQHYETWNLAFITGNLEFHNMLYPKLLIPSVLLADANDYLYHRVLALWLSINFYLMGYLSQHTPIVIPGKEEISKLWGKVNLRYINYMQAQKGEPELPQSNEEEFDETMLWV